MTIKATVRPEGLWVHAEPSRHSRRLTGLKRGDIVEVVGRSGHDWTHVRFKQIEEWYMGWVSSYEIDPIIPPPAPPVPEKRTTAETYVRTATFVLFAIGIMLLAWFLNGG